jgi:endonuclease/exonuclease/phosphatase (EEP) superfamily protein YafD
MRAAVTLAIVVTAACARPERGPRPPTPGRPTVSVMTYNVNFGLAGDPDTIAVIRDAGADVVVLQETTPRWEDHLRRELVGIYPHMEFRHAGGAGGLAVLSRHPVTAGASLPAPAGGWFPAWVVVVDSPLGPLQVLAVHLRPPISDGGSVASGYVTTRSVRVDEIASHLTALDDALPTLIVGDFNEDKDGRALAYLRRRGLRSALPQFHPRADTWRWTTSVGTIHHQLDHVVHDDQLVPIDATVVPGGRSDHLAVLVTLEAVDGSPARLTPARP